MAEELFETINTLVSKSKEGYDHIMIESSGISEPRNIRDQFQDFSSNHNNYEEDDQDISLPILKKVKLEKLITMVDVSTFLKLYESKQIIYDRPDLISHLPDKM